MGNSERAHKYFSINLGVAWHHVQFNGERDVCKRCFRWVHWCRPEDFSGREKVDGRNSVRILYLNYN